jgi:hypothetical protein
MTPEELRERLERGEAVVVNMRSKSSHRDAVAWAKKAGLFVRVDRKNRRWGNPFIEGEDGNRDEVCEKYAAMLQGRPDLLADIGELQGKALGCWCAPKRCHGHELARLANATGEPLDLPPRTEVLNDAERNFRDGQHRPTVEAQLELFVK